MDSDSLRQLLGGVICSRTILPTDFTLIYISNPLEYVQPLCIRVQGINTNYVLAAVLHSITAIEEHMTHPLNYERNDCIMPDEEEFFAYLVADVMETLTLIDGTAKIFLSATPHIYYNTQSGITVHSTYPDDGKLYPQTRVTLVEKGTEIVTTYTNELIVKLPTKE